ncbi:hypothetical protein GGI12_004539 [Dipsacomyces acuminosporus]|nr:hypothetical protein GGI12_004539 [Dipsacomyces acuminosporus]
MDKETWVLWLLADSQLPTGGFVASAGLEAAIQARLVRENALETEDDSFVEFIRSSTHNQARFALPICSQVHERIAELLLHAAGNEDNGQDRTVALILEDVVRIDGYHHAMLSSNKVAMRASIAQGGGLLSLFNRGYAQANFMSDRRGQICVKVAKELQRLSRLSQIRAHWATVFGFVCAAMNIGLGKQT